MMPAHALTHPALTRCFPLYRSAGEGAERSEAGERSAGTSVKFVPLAPPERASRVQLPQLPPQFVLVLGQPALVACEELRAGIGHRLDMRGTSSEFDDEAVGDANIVGVAE